MDKTKNVAVGVAGALLQLRAPALLCANDLQLMRFGDVQCRVPAAPVAHNDLYIRISRKDRRQTTL